MPPHLLVERIQQLLSRRGTGKCSAMEQCPAESAEVEQALRCAVERHTHAVQQIDNRRAGLAHTLHRRLVGQKVAAIDRVIEVGPGRVAFALQILRGVDAALRAHRVRTFHRHDREQVDIAACFSNLDHGG